MSLFVLIDVIVLHEPNMYWFVDKSFQMWHIGLLWSI